MALFQDMSSPAPCSCIVQSNRLVANAQLCGVGVFVIHINFPIVPVQWLHPGPRPLTLSSYPSNAIDAHMASLPFFILIEIFASSIPFSPPPCLLGVSFQGTTLSHTPTKDPQNPLLAVPSWGRVKIPIHRNQLSPDVLPSLAPEITFLSLQMYAFAPHIS